MAVLPSAAMGFNFRSDNESPAAPEIMAALADANAGHAHAYGEDALTTRLNAAYSDLFEREVFVLPVLTGTAANSIALAQLTPPWGAVLCHQGAHIHADECGAPEFYSGGAKLLTQPGDHGRMRPDDVQAVLAACGAHGVHEVLPSAISLSQATESGTVYSLDQVAAFAELCSAHDLGLHMDGARFANALVHLGCSPAELTWKSGVDCLSFGATKNGAMAAEAVIAFDPSIGPELERRRKRAGHLWSKSRYLAAQLLTYIDDGLWLTLAAQANCGATSIAEGLGGINGVELLHPVQANELFLRLHHDHIGKLRQAGYEFHVWPGSNDIIRVVVPWNVTHEAVSGFVAALRV